MSGKCAFFVPLLLAFLGLSCLLPYAGASHSETLQSERQGISKERSVEFEDASIRPARGGGPWSTHFTEDGFEGDAVPVRFLLRVAFGDEIAPPDVLVDVPQWAGDTYTLHAKVAPEDVPFYRGLTTGQRQAMLRKILVDRFNLRFHYGTTTHPAYMLTVEAVPKIMKFREKADYTGTGTDKPVMRIDGMLHFRAHPSSMASLVRRLSWGKDVEERVVIDKTNLPGFYSFDLTWCPFQEGFDSQEATTCNGPSLFSALREQLGLRLRSGEVTVKTVIIDNLEKPTPN